MYNCSISLENFRSFEVFSADFSDRVVIIHGENGSGKTSLLEAIFYVFYGVSFRDRDISSLIKNGTYYSKITLTIDDKEISAYLDRFGNRSVALNGESIARNTLRKSFIPIYSIGRDNLIDGSQSDRRRIINKLASLSIEGFRSVLSAYERIAKNKKEAIIRKDIATLTAINQKFYELYSIISRTRSEVVDRLSSIAERLGYEDMQFIYKPSIIEYSMLEEALHREIEEEKMTMGASFDVIDVRLKGIDARKFLSHGEKHYLWYVLLFEFIKDFSRRYDRGVLMLMDEAFSVLDDAKTKELLDAIMYGPEKVVYFFTTQRRIPVTASYLYLGRAYGRIRADS